MSTPATPTATAPVPPEPGYRFFSHPSHPEVFVRTPNGLIRQVLNAEWHSYGITMADVWPITNEVDYQNFLGYAKAMGYPG